MNGHSFNECHVVDCHFILSPSGISFEYADNAHTEIVDFSYWYSRIYHTRISRQQFLFSLPLTEIRPLRVTDLHSTYCSCHISAADSFAQLFRVSLLIIYFHTLGRGGCFDYDLFEL